MKLSPHKAALELGKRRMVDFVELTKKDYVFNWHHEYVAKVLDRFIKGEIKKLLIFMPPQHGKSELSTRKLTAKLLGHYPQKKIAIVSYSAVLAKSFGKDIQATMDSEIYRKMFPDTKIVATGEKETGYERTKEMVETIPYRGGFRCTGVEGALTGFTVDIGIIDDLYKDRAAALSPAYQETVRNFWESVFIPRLHNDSQILCTFTRWSEDDHGGTLLTDPSWTVIQIPAIRDKSVPTVVDDPRKEGEALWESKHSIKRLKEIKRKSPVVFNSLYQQSPKAAEDILVFPKFEIVDSIPEYATPSGCGIDFGFTNDPTAGVAVAKFKDKIYWDELFYSTHMSNKMIADSVKAAGYANKMNVADSAEPKDIAELNLLGCTVVKANKKTVSSEVNEIKQNFTICVTKRSLNLIKELGKYQYVVVGGKPTNDIVKGWDHAIDAARYKTMQILRGPLIK
jgi:hypothetical protein